MKAIETEYNGYKFRSRTEARWAVFFDQLGIKYEYETQGFDMDGVRYLPDFRLSWGRLSWYIEVKADSAFKPVLIDGLKVYLAGKVSANDGEGFMINDWRDELVDNPESTHKTRVGVDNYGQEKGFMDTTNLFDGYLYTGPYFGEGHNCCNGIHFRSLASIDNSDFVFAWVDSMDAYGTFAEIVYASDHDIPVYIGHPDTLNVSDLWFIFKFATEVKSAPDVRAAWDAIAPKYKRPYITPDESKVMALSKKHDVSEVTIVMGDPYSYEYYSYVGGIGEAHPGKILTFNRDNAARNAAAKFARSARFEFGQTPVVPAATSDVINPWD